MKKKDFKHPKSGKETREVKEARQAEEYQGPCIPWWKDWRQVLLGVIVLVWAVSLVSVTIYDYTHPPTTEELLKR